MLFLILGTAVHSYSGQNRLRFTTLLGVRFGRMLYRYHGQIDSYTEQGMWSFVSWSWKMFNCWLCH